MITIDKINATDWSLSIDQQGEVVKEFADINQCILLIVKTQKGTDPLRPEFGVDLLSYVDKPVNQMVPGLIKEIVESVSIWEPRAIITRIGAKVNGENVTFTLNWEAAGEVGETVITV